jgi:hypothetical protein
VAFRPPTGFVGVITKREAALSALETALRATGLAVQRNPTSVQPAPPDGGLVVMRDGDQGEPEITLSPPRYHWGHMVLIEVHTKPRHGGGEGDRDQIIGVLNEALFSEGADRSLGGAVDWLSADGGALLNAAPGSGAQPAHMMSVTLFYVTDSPWG